MARGDGIDRTSARNAKMTAAKVGNAQAHNERQKESYVKVHCPGEAGGGTSKGTGCRQGPD